MKKVNLNEVKNKILPVFLLILLLVGGSYAWFNYVKVGDKTQVVRAGKYSFKLEECENDIILKTDSRACLRESYLKFLTPKFIEVKVPTILNISVFAPFSGKALFIWRLLWKTKAELP